MSQLTDEQIYESNLIELNALHFDIKAFETEKAEQTQEKHDELSQKLDILEDKAYKEVNKNRITDIANKIYNMRLDLN